MHRRPNETWREFRERSYRRDVLLARLEHLAIAGMAVGCVVLWVSLLTQGGP